MSNRVRERVSDRVRMCFVFRVRPSIPGYGPLL